jgi:hypothetical protein
LSVSEPVPTAPILLIAFNRPDLLEQAIKPLDSVMPSQIFLALDGPREGRHDDVLNVQVCEDLVRAATRRWEGCELTVMRRSENLGMKRASVSATTWFLDRVGAGIIIEDDCVVDPSFVWFSSELLAKYADNAQVMAICGQTYVGAPSSQEDCSYRFARTFTTWAMATWKRSWDLLDADLVELNAASMRTVLRQAPCSTTPFVRFWSRVLNACRDGRNPGWSFPWAYTMWKNGGLCIIPSQNLVTNIGYDERATMTHDVTHRLNRVPIRALDFPLQHPSEVSADCAFDRWSDRNIKGIGWMLELKVLVKRVLRAFRLPDGG